MIKTKKMRRHNKRRTKKLTNTRKKKTRRHNARKHKIGGGPKATTYKKSFTPDIPTQRKKTSAKTSAKPASSLASHEMNEPSEFSEPYVMNNGDDDEVSDLRLNPPNPGSASASHEMESGDDDNEQADDSEDELVNEAAKYTVEQLQKTQISDLLKNKLLLQVYFNTIFKYTLLPREIRLLMCLTERNLYGIINRLLIDRGHKIHGRAGSALINTDNFEIGLVIHGESDPTLPKFDMRGYKNIAMHFLAPESMALAVPTGQIDKFGEALRAAFHGKANVFETFSSSKNPQVIDMRQGTYNQCKDEPGVKEAMGFYLKFKDGTHMEFPIADFNCIYQFYNKMYPSETKDPDNNDTISFEYSVNFINQLIQIISNISLGLFSDDSRKKAGIIDAPINLYQICCRPYVHGTKISPQIKELQDAVSLLGSPHILIERGIITITLDKQSGFSLIKSNARLDSHSGSLEQFTDDNSKFDYTVKKIREIAIEIASKNAPLGSSPENAKIYWFRKLVSYFNMINFEFARHGIPVSENAEILSSLTNVTPAVIISETPYVTSQQKGSPSLSRDELVKDCNWGNPTQTSANNEVVLKDVSSSFFWIAPISSLTSSKCSSDVSCKPRASAANSHNSYSVSSLTSSIYSPGWPPAYQTAASSPDVDIDEPQYEETQETSKLPIAEEPPSARQSFSSAAMSQQYNTQAHQPITQSQYASNSDFKPLSQSEYEALTQIQQITYKNKKNEALNEQLQAKRKKEINEAKIKKTQEYYANKLSSKQQSEHDDDFEFI